MWVVQTDASGEQETPVLFIHLLVVLEEVDAQHKGKEQLERERMLLMNQELEH